MSIFGTADQWNRGVLRLLRTIMHFIGAFHFWYAIYYDFAFVYPSPTHPAYLRSRTFAGKFKYLTFLDAVINIYKINNKFFHSFYQLIFNRFFFFYNTLKPIIGKLILISLVCDSGYLTFI